MCCLNKKLPDPATLMDNVQTTRPIPISKILVIAIGVLVLMYIMWKVCSPSQAPAPVGKKAPSLKTEEEIEADAEHNPPQQPPQDEYDTFMARLQKSEVAARKRALALAEEEAKSRVAEEERRRAKEIERVKHHTQPIGAAATSSA